MTAATLTDAAFLWAIGREDEARALDEFIEFTIADDATLWAAHRELIVHEWRREHPDASIPPILRRLRYRWPSKYRDDDGTPA